MLLELYAARLEGYAVWISSLCIASCVPSTTALRWVKSLCDQGLLVRKADERDSRRVFIELSDQAAVAMSGYLAAARQASEMAT
jgi:DNA-binding MarR family transcriptional regulator